MKYIKEYMVDESIEDNIVNRIMEFMDTIYSIFDKAQTNKIPTKALRLSLYSKKFNIPYNIMVRLKTSEFKIDKMYTELKNKERMTEERARTYAKKLLA